MAQLQLKSNFTDNQQVQQENDKVGKDDIMEIFLKEFRQDKIDRKKELDNLIAKFEHDSMANKVQFAELEERINNVNLSLDLGLTRQLEKDKVPMFSDKSSISLRIA